MTGKRVKTAKKDKRRRTEASTPPSRADVELPLSVPGYGTPPVTRPYDGGPEPASYGIPPHYEASRIQPWLQP
jgi:hypothetical protein